MFLGVCERGSHPFREAGGESDTVFACAVIELACGDVSACTVEVNVQRVREVLSADETGDARKIGRGDPESVVALGMASVGGEDCYGCCSIPEADGRDEGIDIADRFCSDCGILGCGVAGCADPSIWTKDASSAGDVADFRAAPAPMGNWARFGESVSDCSGGSGDDLSLEGAVEALETIDAEVFEEAFCGEIASGRIVLMQGMDGDVVGACLCCSSKCHTESFMTFIGDADPVDGAENDGVFDAGDDDASATEGEFIDPFHRVVRHG